MDACAEVRKTETEGDRCPACCRHCHDGDRCWYVIWRGERRAVCCAVVAFALRHGAQADPETEMAED